MNKFSYLLLGFLILNSFANAQEQDSLFIKLKEQQNEKQFYNSIFRNPAFMPDFGNYRLSSLEVNYKQEKNQNYLIQKPEHSNDFGIKAKSYYPLNQSLTLWGNASYNNISHKNITWNGSVDYSILYPYFTADEKGGDMQQENYAFLGGVSKKTKQFDWGASIDYQAKLASRSKDPRPQNISSNLKLNTGIKWKNILHFNIGLNAGIQKYSQSNEILFFNEREKVPIFHLNGLGNYNHLLKGDKTDSFYDGFGYSGGVQLVNSRQKNLFINFNFNELNFDKIIRLSTNIEASKLKNRNIETSVTKLFNTTSENKYGVKIDYILNSKLGVESILKGRSSINEIIAQNENYSLNNEIFQLSGMYHSTKYNLYFSPYINYEAHREKNIYPVSFQNFDYLNSGFNLNYFYTINPRNLLQFQFDFQYHKTLKKETLLNNDKAIGDMIERNYLLLSKGFTNTKFNIQFNHKMNTFSTFAKLGSEFIFFGKNTNTIFSVSSGINF
ncbi:hypothetical protein KRX57_08180 [Weeksellaceae bacterium TAE3-ERU29]|nr:hypothetical protein [Weeksellaceae bacterium TAE3-ERU29]